MYMCMYRLALEEVHIHARVQIGLGGGPICMHAYLRAYLHMCMGACMRAYMHACTPPRRRPTCPLPLTSAQA